MTERDYLLQQIREAIAEEPGIDAISIRPDLKTLLGVDTIDGVAILGDQGYELTTSGTIH